MDYYEAGYQFRVHHSDMVTDEEDSRDSGVSLTADDISQLCDFDQQHSTNNTTEFNSATKLRPPMNKTFDMENLCELKIDELCSDLNDIENRADQFLRRRISNSRISITSSTDERIAFNQTTPMSCSSYDNRSERRDAEANRGDASTSSTVYNSDCMISQTPIFNRHLSRKRKCGQQIEYCERIKKTKLLTHTQKQQTEIHLNKNQELCHPLKAIATAKPFQRAFSTSAIETSSSSRHHLYNTSQNNEFELPKLLEVEYSLETVHRPQIDSCAFRSISAETLIKLFSEIGDDEFYSKFILIDCRYPYEFNGGHIKGALNVYSPDELNRVFFPEDTQQFSTVSKRIPIFYCEFSQKRGPKMAYALRAHDRRLNELCYPNVFYKEIYLIDYGYRRFHQLTNFMNLHLCHPNGYVQMVDKKFVNELRSFKLHRCKSICTMDQSVQSFASDNSSSFRLHGSVLHSTPRSNSRISKSLLLFTSTSPSSFSRNMQNSFSESSSQLSADNEVIMKDDSECIEQESGHNSLALPFNKLDFSQI